MKRLLAILLTLMLTLSLVACGNKTDSDMPENLVAEEEIEETSGTELEEKEEKEDKKEEKKEEEKKEEDKKPEEKPAEKPEEAPQNTTLGKTLLADFKAKASSGMGALSIAEALLANPAILFSGGAVEVEPGLLSGFDNTEITGFKSGAVFMPMIGSIPFIGYVFELDNAADASAFIAKLESAANPRWNICVTADETVTGSYGNKVFFVMCPTSLEG